MVLKKLNVFSNNIGKEALLQSLSCYDDIILCLGFRASYVNIYKENQLDAV